MSDPWGPRVRSAEFWRIEVYVNDKVQVHTATMNATDLGPWLVELGNGGWTFDEIAFGHDVEAIVARGPKATKYTGTRYLISRVVL